MAWRRQLRRDRLLGHREQDFVMASTVAQIIEEEEEECHRRGSVPGRVSVPRDRYSGYWRLMADYFGDSPVYGENLFRRR